VTGGIEAIICIGEDRTAMEELDFVSSRWKYVMLSDNAADSELQELTDCTERRHPNDFDRHVMLCIHDATDNLINL
jgi:hypothetical protein